MGSNEQNRNHKRWFMWLRAFTVVLFICAAPICVMALLVMQATADSGEQQDNYHQQQTLSCIPQLSMSLSTDVIRDLCSRDLIPSDLGQCNATQTSLTRRSIETIMQASVKIGTTTYNDVKMDFGRYEIVCSDVNTFGNDFTCDYDLSENSLIVTIAYDASTQLVKSLGSRTINC